MWVHNLEDVAAWLMKSFVVVTDGVSIPKQGFIDPLGDRAFLRNWERCFCGDLFCICCVQRLQWWAHQQVAVRDTCPSSNSKFINACSCMSSIPKASVLKCHWPCLCCLPFVTWILVSDHVPTHQKPARGTDGFLSRMRRVRWRGDPLLHLSHTPYASRIVLKPELGFSRLSPSAASGCGIYW